MTLRTPQEDTVKEIYAYFESGKTEILELRGSHFSVGRSRDNDLSVPADSSLSRHHCMLEIEDHVWTVRDLGSKNGTVVNGAPVTGRWKLRPGDTITAGRIKLVFDEGSSPTVADHLFDDTELPRSTVQTSLKQVLDQSDVHDESAGSGAWKTPLQVFVRAGRELSKGRSLEDLFQVILELSVEAVGADRGVLLTLEGDDLLVRASRGEGLKISRTVRESALRGHSVLAPNVASDAVFNSRDSILAQKVSTLMAAPMQTDEEIVGIIYVDSLDPLRGFSRDDMNLLTALANVSSLRLERKRMIEIQQERIIMARELEQAARIQQRILPGEAPSIPGIQLAGYNCACNTVGGDYYDYWQRPDGRLVLAVGDVSGKGMPAALMMMSLQARVQILGQAQTDPAELNDRLNRIMLGDGFRNRFVTLFKGLLDPITGELTYCNAGHNPPVLLRSGGEIEFLEEGGPILGLFPTATYGAAQCRIDPGDTLALFSDGITEAFDLDEREFGLTRLTEVLRRHSESNAETILQKVVEAVGEWSADVPLGDDLTLVVLRRSE